jgi:hypothetical protein
MVQKRLAGITIVERYSSTMLVIAALWADSDGTQIQGDITQHRSKLRCTSDGHCFDQFLGRMIDERMKFAKQNPLQVIELLLAKNYQGAP